MKANELSIQTSAGVAHGNEGSVAITAETASHSVGEDTTMASELPVSFKAKRCGSFANSKEWNITLGHTKAEFTDPEMGERIEIERQESNRFITFDEGFSLLPSKNFILNAGKKSFSFKLDGHGRSQLVSWLPKHQDSELKSELRKWGVGLIILGGLHFILQGLLDPAWGVVLFIVGG
jgi:hypothetical protein